MITAVRFLRELMGDKDDLFGDQPSRQVREAQLNSASVGPPMLDGLVPVRGRLTEYNAVHLGDREFLVHRSITGQLGVEHAGDLVPTYVAGVAQDNLFWKDIRQVLFSEAQYNVFCRLAKQGLMEDWQPIKAADIFEGNDPAIQRGYPKH